MSRAEADEFTATGSLVFERNGRRFADATVRYYDLTREQVVDLEGTVIGALMAKAKSLAKD